MRKASTIEQLTPTLNFGMFLKIHREQWNITQREVLLNLPGWTQASYSRLEGNVLAPGFEQLQSIYTALSLAGAPWALSDLHQFLTLARKRIEQKKSHLERRSDTEWATLRYNLASSDALADDLDSTSTTDSAHESLHRPLLAETRHLLGREEWVSTVIHTLQGTPLTKLLVLRGPMGVGKSSELHRLARHFLQMTQPSYQVVWVSLLPVERGGDAENALDVSLATVLAESGIPPLPTAQASLKERITYALIHLQRSTRPMLILLDNAECLLTEQGILTSCWEQFLTAFLQCEHSATLVLASKEWPGWSGRDSIFVAETTVPALTLPTSIQLLQRLGLDAVPVEHLQRVSERAGGLPLCLEWIARLVQQPFLLDDWNGFALEEHPDPQGEHTSEEIAAATTQRLLHLLQEPSLLQGHFATKLQPLLQRLIEKRLSPEARTLLNVLALCNVPLGKPALQVLCSRPAFLKELRDASLLVTYPHRAQLLPMVASAVRQQLSPDQTHELEKQLIDALTCWLQEGNINIQESGNIITELTVLLLNQHRLLDAAQLLIPYSSLSFNLGHAARLAQLAEDVMQQMDWQATKDAKCGGLLLRYFLLPFLGRTIHSEQQREDYQRILDAVRTGTVVLSPEMEGHVVSYLMLFLMNDSLFEETQATLDTYRARLESSQSVNVGRQVYLLELYGWLFGTWCDYVEAQGDKRIAQQYRRQTIDCYRQCIAILSTTEDLSRIKNSLSKTRLARCYNVLGYHLARNGQYEEALQFVEQSILLKEQGYCSFGSLAASYGEKSEILVELGRFREALLFDEKAMEEVERCASTGDASSQEEQWMYRANRGRLYLQLGKIDEAEHLLRDAIPHISKRRSIYQMFAEKDLNRIEEWRNQATSPHYQLDWQWVERYRILSSFDSYWWLTAAGPFNEDEQEQWEQKFTLQMDESIKKQLGELIAQSRERELMTAIVEQREPHLHYPAIDIKDLQNRIANLVHLDADIRQYETNPIVRSLYHETIEEELDYLYLIKATYDRDNEQFWRRNVRLNPVPTDKEMDFAISRVEQIVRRGLQHPETTQISQNIQKSFQENLLISLNLLSDQGIELKKADEINQLSSQSQRIVSAQAAKRFFDAVLHKFGYEGWKAVIDPNASSSRVEQGLRQIFLVDKPVSIGEIRHLISHELAGHVARCIAGEQSPLGLLGIHTKNSLVTEEGLAIYFDRQTARQSEQNYDDTSVWVATLATGLASGAVTPPQTFLSLFRLFKTLYLLYQLLRNLSADMHKAEEIAIKYALYICLRTFRGVPNLTQPGICYTKDALYLRGLWKIENAVAQDETVLDRLSVGVVALEQLSNLQELNITASPRSLRRLANDLNLDSYILSFED